METLLAEGEAYQVQANALIGFLLDKLDGELDDMDRVQINKWSQASQRFDDALAKAAPLPRQNVMHCNQGETDGP